MTTPAKYIWIDGSLQEISQQHSSVLAHGLHYGTGVFEGIRCYTTPNGPAVFRLDAHLLRMRAGAEVLGIDLNVGQLTQAVSEVLSANRHSSAYVRPIAFYGSGSLGLDVGPQLKHHVVVASMPWRSHLGEAAENRGVSMKSTPVRRISADAVPPLKLTGVYVNSIIAKRAAVSDGYEEALFVDPDGRVCEATGENVFMIRNGEVTAVAHPDALPGITRDSVMQLTGASERPVFLPELKSADEIFLTGTSAEVAPVTRIDDVSLPIGPVTRRLQDLYQHVVHGRHPGRDAWLTPVESWAAAAR